MPRVKTTLGAFVLVTAIGLAACGSSGSKSASGTTAPTSAAPTTTVPAATGSPPTTVAPTGSPAFCSQVDAVLNKFQAVSNPTSTDIANAAASFDHLATTGPASLKPSLSAVAGDFRQLVGILKTDPQALTREEPNVAEQALATRLQGDLTPLVTYRKTCPA